MGNSYSNHNYNNNNSECIICWENVEDIDKVTKNNYIDSILYLHTIIFSILNLI